MKTVIKTITAITFIAITTSLYAPGMAATSEDNHSAMSTQAKTPTPAKAQMVDGLVKKVDKTAGKVTISHGPILNLGMTMGMTMAFRVNDAAWLDQMKAGDKIRFMADEVNGALTIVHFEAVK